MASGVSGHPGKFSKQASQQISSQARTHAVKKAEAGKRVGEASSVRKQTSKQERERTSASVRLIHGLSVSFNASNCISVSAA